jgi:hypothetical protein
LSITLNITLHYMLFIVTSPWNSKLCWTHWWIPTSISQPKFWLNPSVQEHKSHRLSGCSAQILIAINFNSHFLLFYCWLNPNPSAWNPIISKNKQIPDSQFPFHPFSSLSTNVRSEKAWQPLLSGRCCFELCEMSKNTNRF